MHILWLFAWNTQSIGIDIMCNLKGGPSLVTGAGFDLCHFIYIQSATDHDNIRPNGTLFWFPLSLTIKHGEY